MSTTASWDQASHILALVGQKGTKKDQIQALIRTGLLSDLLDANVDVVDREDFRKILGLSPLQPRITIDYSLSRAEMITAGHYDSVRDFVDAYCLPFSKIEKVEIAVELLHFDRTISSNDARAEMKRRGLRPATIAELLSYGTQFPEDQRKFPIIALGSSAAVGGDLGIGCLDGDRSYRSLRLSWVGGDWIARCRFLVVRI